MTLSFQEYNGVREYGGPGHALFILHGLFGNKTNWHNVASSLAEDIRVFTMDLRNHGKSPHSPVFDYREMAMDVASLARAQGLESIAVMGHSMGGKVAMRLALDMPDSVTELISVDMAPRRYEHVFDTIFEALLALDPGKFTSRTKADKAMALHLPDPGVRQFLLQNLERTDVGNFRWRMNLEVLRRDYPIIAAAMEGGTYEGPTLFLRGGESTYVSEEDLENARPLFPNAQMSTILGAGHWVHADKPQELIDVVRNFVLR